MMRRPMLIQCWANFQFHFHDPDGVRVSDALTYILVLILIRFLVQVAVGSHYCRNMDAENWLFAFAFIYL